MYRVLLVDDEENILEILRNTVRWQELGVEALLAAPDGQDALELCSQQAVDLLITDIKMPRMDGISLIREVKRRYPDTRCILLTAYGEFEYAREAINLGVENYLLKPVSAEEVEQTVSKALRNLYSRRRNDESLLRDNILCRWAEGKISGEVLSDHAAVLGLNLYLPRYCAVCIIRRTDAPISGFCSFCAEQLAQKHEVYSFWDEKGRYVLILGGRQLDTAELEKELAELADRQEAEGILGICVGAAVANAEALCLSYREACDSAELSDLNAGGPILHSICPSRILETDYLVEEVRFLFFTDNDQNRNNGYRHLAHKLYQEAKDGATGRLLGKLLGICMQVLLTEFPLQENLQERIFGCRWKIEGGQSGEVFSAEAIRILGRGEEVFRECFSQYSPIVQLTVKYVRNEAMKGNGVSIREFCQGNGMNPAYLGHVFKKETGVFFNDYLMQCRINRSVILLRNPNNKIKDIAEMVGFASVSYYVKCFRESKGTAPARYRLGLDE